MSSWVLDLTGFVRNIDGRDIQIEEQLTELDTNEPVMLKVRYDLNPKNFEIEDPDDREIPYNDFILECDLAENVNGIGHAPRYITHLTKKPGPGFPYQKGFLDYLVMSRVPGETVGDIYMDLSHEQLESMRKQLAYILEHMRQDGWTLSEQHPDFLRYDIENVKLYLVDFTFFNVIEPDEDDIIRG